VLFGLVVTVSAGTLMLALSSLSRNSLLVGATFIGLWVVGDMTASVLQQTVDRTWCPLVSYTTNLARLRDVLLDGPGSRGKFLALWEAGREARERAARPIFLFGRLRHPKPPPDVPPSNYLTPDYLRYPCSWSCGVLLGLFALSVATLSTRVKSLDQLR
jgi:hypothetical protein